MSESECRLGNEVGVVRQVPRVFPLLRQVSPLKMYYELPDRASLDMPVSVLPLLKVSSVIIDRATSANVFNLDLNRGERRAGRV